MAVTRAERGGTSVSGVAPQEAGQPQVEYRPFSDFTPEQLADLTGGEIETTGNHGEPWPWDDWRIILYPAGLQLTWNGTDWLSHNHKRRHSTLEQLGSQGIKREIQDAIVITDNSEPGVLTFVNPTDQYPTGSGIPTRYEWIRLERTGASFEMAIEGNPKLTDEIRRAADLALKRKNQAVTSSEAA